MHVLHHSLFRKQSSWHRVVITPSKFLLQLELISEESRESKTATVDSLKNHTQVFIHSWVPCSWLLAVWLLQSRLIYHTLQPPKQIDWMNFPCFLCGQVRGLLCECSECSCSSAKHQVKQASSNWQSFHDFCQTLNTKVARVPLWQWGRPP